MDALRWHGGADGRIAWAAAGRATAGQPISGDVHVAVPFRGGMLAGVIDGLGHGRDARASAERARETLAAAPAAALEVLVASCHESLRRLRGAVLSVASFDFAAGRMTWLGVGNVEAVLVRHSGARERLLTRGGVLGQSLPVLRPASLAVDEGDTVVMASDGIRPEFADTLRPGASVVEVAEHVLAAHATGTDDALVLAARLLGGRA